MTSEAIRGGNPSGAGQEMRVLAGISVAHWVSHFHIMTLPPLFPFLTSFLGVSYIQLGFAMTVFAVVSMFTQAPMGVLVDRFGAKKILLAGLCVGGSAFILVGIVPTYAGLIACTAIAGLANSVYHPCDYSILNSGIRESRLGRAFSIHTFAGFFGGAVAPAAMLVLVAQFGIEIALFTSGILAFAAAALIVVIGVPEAERVEVAAKDKKAGSLSVVLSPAILMLTGFFVLLSLSNSGINNFSVAALMSGYGMSEVSAGTALTAFLAAMAVGVLAGGFLAERTKHHGAVAAIFFTISAAFVAMIALVPMPVIVLIGLMGGAGFCSGVIAPSRDMLVRKAAPPGAMGRAFAVVSTGFNIGMMAGPLLYALIMDQGAPKWIFGVTVIMMLVTVALALVTERHDTAKAAASS